MGRWRPARQTLLFAGVLFIVAGAAMNLPRVMLLGAVLGVCGLIGYAVNQ